MTPVLFVAVAIAGGLGAAVRYTIDALVGAVLGARFPWGILLVNVTGSFALGVLVGADAGESLTAVVGLGFLGGYTTFSAVCVTAVTLAEDRRFTAASVYTVVTALAAIPAAAAGFALAGGFSG